MITHKRLKEKLEYNPETGLFTWLIKYPRGFIGDVAGTKNKLNGYWYIRLDGKQYLGHRLAWLYMTESWPKYEVDHINHEVADNRFANLRDVLPSVNGKNRPPAKGDPKCTGVNLHRDKKRWTARLIVNNKSKCLGVFSDKFEAICARMSANNKYGYHENHGR